MCHQIIGEIINAASFYEEFRFEPIFAGHPNPSDVLNVVRLPEGGDPDDPVSDDDLETVEEEGGSIGLPSCRVY